MTNTTADNNLIDLPQPDSDVMISQDIPADSSARLNFGPQDIMGLRLGDEGELIISFENGGQLNITNFEDIVDNGNLLYLEDGTLIDPSILTTSLQSPQDLNAIETAAGAATNADAIVIAKPEADTTQEISLEPGQKYICEFDPSNVAGSFYETLVEIKDGQMILTFADGSQVIINNYAEAMSGDLPAELTLADGTVIDSEQLLTQLTEVETPSEEVLEVVETEPEPQPEPQQVANVEPAAGEDLNSVAEALAEVEPAAGETPISNTGFGFGSSPSSAPLDSVDAIGPLGPTALRFTLPEVLPEQSLLLIAPDSVPTFTLPVSVLDETNLAGGNLTVTDTISVDFGTDGPAAVNPFCGNGVFTASGEITGGTLSSNGVPVVVTFDSATQTYTGVAGATTIFTFVLDTTNSEFTYTQFEQFDHSNTANDNEPAFLDFGIKATDSNGDTTNTSVRINVLDDAPIVTSQVPVSVDETNFTGGPLTQSGQFFANPGQDTPVSYAGNNTFNATGSVDNGVLTSNGVPVVVTFDAGTQTYTGTAGGNTVFTFVLNPTTGAFDYTQLLPLDHADTTDPDDVITLEFGANIVDFDGDATSGTLLVEVRDDAPVVAGDTESLDETDTFPTMVNGNVNANFGGDGAGSVAGNNTFSATGSVAGGNLTSNGVPVVVTFDAGTQTYTGTAGGNTIFTFVLNPATGNYDFTLNGPLDHADGNNPNDVITLNFGVNAIDFDGDATAGTVSVNVLDDVPQISNDSNKIEEQNLSTGPIVVTDTVPHSFGQDGAGEICGNNVFMAKDQPNGAPIALTSGGNPVIVNFDSATNTYTGVANGTTVFTLVIEADGDYTFTLNQPIDHTSSGADTLWLNFGVKIVDFDGDTDTAFINIDVVDDVPSIGTSSGDVDETNFDQGPLVHTDVLVFDGDGPLTITPNGNVTPSTPLISCGHPVTVTNNNGVYTGTANGETIFTLAVDPTTGSYTYTQFKPLDHPDSTNPDDILSIDFGVLVTESDGDMANTTITINIADDGPDAVEDINGAEEGQFITGDVRANDILSQDGDDNGGNTVTNVLFNGVNSPVPAGGSVTIVGTYGTLVMNSDGTYNYTANTNDPNGVDNFVYTLTDKDGDSDTATLDITVTPDGQPVAVSQLIAVDETNLTPGPMIFNGDLNVDFGLDGAGTVTPTNAASFVAGGSLAGGALTSGGVPVVVTLSGNTYTGSAGGNTVFTVTINNDGTYQFQLFDRIDHADSTDPNDIITMQFGVVATDSDGDSTQGTFTVNVHDDAPVALDDGAQAVVESQTVVGNVVTGVGGPNATADELSEDNPTLVDDVIFNGVTTPVPAVGSVSIVGNFGTLTISANGAYSYTANNNNPNGTDTFTYVLQDFDGDRDTAEFSFNVEPIDDQPIIAPPPVVSTDDTDLAGGPDVATGTIVVNFGSDTPGSIDPNNIFSSSVQNLTACNEPITVTLSGNTYTGTAVINGISTPIFTMTILENGNFTFTQLHAIDHPDTVNPNDVVTLNFGATATDSDGDTASTTLQVRVFDDGPQISQAVTQVDEDTLATGNNIVATGTVPHSFGQDGAGSITATGLFQAKFQQNGASVNLTSNGNPVTVTNNANSYTGTANGQTIFTITIDPATGAYTYTQFQPVDHPDGTDPNDVIWLQFSVQITDKDGDTDSSVIVIDVADDGPNAVNDTDFISRTDTTETGNVLTNDSFGADDGSNARLLTTGTFVGNFGTLVLNANGSYTYTRAGQTGGTDTFSYTIQDADGDTDTATLTMNVEQDDNPINISGTGATDDTALASGPDVETGTISVNYQGDGPGTTTGNGNFSSSGNQTGGTLSHNGTPVNVSFNAGNNTYTGTAGGQTVFTMTINANGTYRFTQFDDLDHSNTNSNNEALFLNFGVTATDSDGDTGNGTVTITVRDDAPNAVNDSASISRFGNSASGNVLNNDSFGQDSPGGALLTAGTFVGNFGTLTLNSNGSYSYVRFGRAGGTDTFNYTIRDNDGDTDTAQLSVSVTANPPPPPPPPPPRGGDGDGGGDGGGGDGCPIVLDLDGDGIEMTTREDGVLFDIWDNGGLNQTAWVQSDDALLVLDNNGDGRINHEDLVGDATTDGFSELASYNSNGDGVIDANDAAWSELRAWRDLNQDGISQEGELFTLDEVGIASLSLGTTQTDYYNNGSWTPVEGSFTRTDGTTGLAADVWFDFELNGELPVHEVKTDEELNAIDVSTLSIGDNPDGEGPVVHGPLERLYEELLSDVEGPLVIRDKVQVFHDDGDTLGGVQLNGQFVVTDAINRGTLSSNGQTVTVTQNGNMFIGMAGATIVFTMEVLANGVYTFELHETLDHYDPTTADEDITLAFGLDIYDSSGDMTETSIRIRIKDDGAEIETQDDSIADVTTDGSEIIANDAAITHDVSHSIDDDGCCYAVDGEQDMFLFQAVADEATEIKGFNAAEGDVVDLSLLIEGNNDVTEAIQEFVYVSETEDGDTVISVDVDGANGPAEAVEVAKLDNVTGASVDDLIDNGNIVI